MAIHSSSFDDCRTRFDSEIAARIYSTRHLTSRKGQRELICVIKALKGLKNNALILDIPCGTGRLSYDMSRLGYRVIGADYSQHMIKYAESYSPRAPNAEVTFMQQDIMAINLDGKTIDAVVCNRLFHHYQSAKVRREVLKALAKVTTGPIIISFFNSYSLSGLWSKIKKFLGIKKTANRMPISYFDFKKDIEACQLKVDSIYFTRFGLSPQTYLKLIHKK